MKPQWRSAFLLFVAVMAVPQVKTIAVSEGQHASIVIRHRGGEVIARLLDGDGKICIESRSESPQGEEKIEMVADRAGAYRVEIRPSYPNASGESEMSAADVRPASEQDRQLYEARKLLTQTMRLNEAAKYDEAAKSGEQA